MMLSHQARSLTFWLIAGVVTPVFFPALAGSQTRNKEIIAKIDRLKL